MKNYEDFLKLYGKDKIVPLKPEEAEKIIEFEKCLNCGLCLSQCPVLRTLSDEIYPGPRAIAISLSRSIPDFSTLSDIIYNCTNCEACEAICSQDTPVRELVNLIRSKIPVQYSEAVPYSHQVTQENINKFGNVYGAKIELFSKEKKTAENIIFIGCVGNFRERKSVEQTLSLLDKLSVDYTTIKESCCGYPLPLLGFNEEKKLMKKNLEKIKTKKAKRIITLCPACYRTFKFSPLYQNDVEVMHLSDFLNQFKFKIKYEGKVTYHDPCDLGRDLGIFEKPRELIKKVAANFVELENSKEFSQCCGAGGGVRGCNVSLSMKIARNRLNEVESLGADILLTECLSCLHNFKNAKKPRQKFYIYTISEFINRLLEKTIGAEEELEF